MKAFTGCSSPGLELTADSVWLSVWPRALASKVCFSHYHQHPFLACKTCLTFVFYTLFLQSNAFQYECQCSSCAITLVFCQRAKLLFPVTVSTCRCPSPVKAPRCNRMRNPSQFPQDRLGITQGAELGKLHPGRGGRQAPVTTGSGILYKLPRSSSPSCHAR